jgi:hypothetical protein
MLRLPSPTVSPILGARNSIRYVPPIYQPKTFPINFYNKKPILDDLGRPPNVRQ